MSVASQIDWDFWALPFIFTLAMSLGVLADLAGPDGFVFTMFSLVLNEFAYLKNELWPSTG